MKLTALPAFTDNYIWMLHDGQEALIVDPGDAAVAEQAVASLGLKLTAILVTHHHADHIGGLAGLLHHGAKVHGPHSLVTKGVTHPVQEGDTVTWRALSFRVMAIPGHTADHVAYWASAWNTQATPLLFCGDTLFSSGCGRVFDGRIEDLHDSLARLAHLPSDTEICPAHEYTLGNLRFAMAVEPGNEALIQHHAWAQTTRDQGAPTLPTRLGLELSINPFLRCTSPEVVRNALAHGAIDSSTQAVFAELRRWKNTF